MGLLSSLGLLLIPLVSRSRSTSVIPIDPETKRLKAELAEARAEVERLRLEVLHWMDFADTVRRHTPPLAPIYQINEDMRQQMQAHQQAPYQQWLGLQAQAQNICNCTPPHGRAGYLLRGGIGSHA